MRLVLLTLLALPVVFAQTAPQRDIWVAFRYDADRVIFYTERLIDPVVQQTVNALLAPMAEYGGGGYLLPLTPERLATFQPHAGGERVQLNEKYTLWLDGENVVEATTEAYVEQWGSENPVVRVAVIARVARPFKGDYFLISRERSPRRPFAGTDRTPLRASRNIVGSFGPIGNLAIDRGEYGWIVALVTTSGGRTNVEYSYGD